MVATYTRCLPSLSVSSNNTSHPVAARGVAGSAFDRCEVDDDGVGGRRSGVASHGQGTRMWGATRGALEPRSRHGKVVAHLATAKRSLLFVLVLACCQTLEHELKELGRCNSQVSEL